MPETNTVNHLFTLAITAENVAEAMYLVLAQRFAPYAEVARFWREMAHAEAIHARVLERMRARLEPAALQSPVDPAILQLAYESTRMDTVAAARAAANLEVAYQLAHEAEHSEINTVFEFLVTAFPENPTTGEFLREQLQTHVQKLVKAFPAPFHQAAARWDILPVDRF